MAAALLEVRIARLGAQGDGIGEASGEAGGTSYYVPFTVPGDVVRIAPGAVRGEGRAAEAVERLADGPGRATPPCPHFTVCGGCALQHLAAEPYAAWKRDQVVRALAQRGFEGAAVAPLVPALPGTRRRVSLAIVKAGRGVKAGFRERGDRAVVDVAACPMAEPRLVALLPPLRDLVAAWPVQRLELRAVATETDTGIDLLIVGAPEPDRAGLGRLAAFAEAAGLARLSLQGRAGAGIEPVVVRRRPALRFGGVDVSPPPGAFVQATAAGEAAIGNMVAAATAGARRIADLYAGCGTWTFRMAGTSHRAGLARVHAAEGDAGLVAALNAAAGAAGQAGRVTAETRDLARRPLAVEELNRYDAVVFDPPRAGAREQAAELARSTVPLVVAVSCSPATFARDARILADGGYVLERVMPVDQFLWTPHVELAAVLRRPGRR